MGVAVGSNPEAGGGDSSGEEEAEGVGVPLPGVATEVGVGAPEIWFAVEVGVVPNGV